MSHKLQKDDVSVAILAGGKSSRMEGEDKFNHDNVMFLNINSKEDIEINKDLISKIYG